MKPSFKLACLAFVAAPVLATLMLFPLEPVAAPKPTPAPAAAYLSPAALAATKGGGTLYIACATANQVAVFDVAQGKVTRTIALPERPTGLALSPDESRLFVTCAAPQSKVVVVDPVTGKVSATLPAGH